MGLPRLRSDASFRAIAVHLAEAHVEPPLVDDPASLVISHLSFCAGYSGESPEALLDAWLWDSSKRPVLLGPGNVGAVHISGSFVAVWVGFVFKS
jgi:hypothetical protein